MGYFNVKVDCYLVIFRASQLIRVSTLIEHTDIRCYTWLVFRKKDLYLVITQKLTKLHMKTIAVFMKSGSFCENHCGFHEKQQFFVKTIAVFMKTIAVFVKSTCKVKSTKTADSTQISHFDLVFHRIQREGQLCISLFWWCLVVHACVYGAHICTFNCACMWCMYVHVVICTHLVVHVCAYGACMCTWCIYEKHLKSEKHMKSTPEKWKIHKKHLKSNWKLTRTKKAHLKSENTWKAHLKSEKHMKSTLQKWKVHEKHLKSEKHMKSTLQKWKVHEKHMKSTPEKWKAYEKNTSKVKSTPQKWKTHEKQMKSEKNMKSPPQKWKAPE